jgi:hypothetical protein
MMRAMRAAYVLLIAIGCGSIPDEPLPDGGSSPATPVCGDGLCESNEVGACPSDCGAVGACGDGTCGTGETATTCPADCTSSALCGDGTCTPPETAATCPGDCSTGGGGTASCGNFVCDAGEDATNCPLDCSGGGTSTCPGDPVDCVFCWVDPTSCIPPQTEAICEQCLGLGGGSSGPCYVDLVCDVGEDPTNCPSDCP